MAKGKKKGGFQNADFIGDITSRGDPQNGAEMFTLLVAALIFLFFFRTITNWFCGKTDIKVGQKVKAYITPSATVTKKINGEYITQKEFYQRKLMDAVVTATPGYFTPFIVDIDTSSQANMDKSYEVTGCDIVG